MLLAERIQNGLFVAYVVPSFVKFWSTQLQNDARNRICIQLFEPSLYLQALKVGAYFHAPNSVADPEVLARGGEWIGHKGVESGEGPCPFSEIVFEF